MNNTHLQKPLSFSSNRNSVFRTNSNYNNKSFSHWKKLRHNKNGFFSSKLLQKSNIKVTQTKDAKYLPNIIEEYFPSLPNKVNTKLIAKQQEIKTNKVEENVSKNSWGKKNTIQHIKKCYQKIDNENRKKEEEKEEKEEKKRKKVISKTNNKLFRIHSNIYSNKYFLTKKQYEYDSDADADADDFHYEYNNKDEYMDSEDEDDMNWLSE